jgi:hypothetical protein
VRLANSLQQTCLFDSVISLVCRAQGSACTSTSPSLSRTVISPRPSRRQSDLLAAIAFWNGASGTARHRDIDNVRDCLAFDALVKQRQRKTGLELDHDRVLVTTHRDNICCADLALDDVALAFEQGFDRSIKLCFPGFGSGHDCLLKGVAEALQSQVYVWHAPLTELNQIRTVQPAKGQKAAPRYQVAIFPCQAADKVI